MWDVVIARWIERDKLPVYAFPDLALGRRLIGTDGELDLGITWDSEAVLLPGYVSFDHPLCGIRVILDGYDSEKLLNISTLNSPGGIVLPNNWIHVSKYDTDNNIYSLEIHAFPPCFKKLQVTLINTDRTAGHNVISYALPWAHI